MRTALLIGAFGCWATLATAAVLPPVPHVPASVLNPDGEPGEAKEKDSPADLADRIAANTKQVGDRLQNLDAGNDTRKTQDQILKDIDELLKQTSNSPPPPMPMGGGGMGEGNQSQPMPSGSSGNAGKQTGNSGPSNSGKPPPMGGNSGKSQPMPGGKGGWRERVQQANAGEKPMGGKQQPGEKEAGPNGEPMAKNTGGKPDPKQPGQTGTGEPGMPMGNDGGLGGKSPPGMPLDDAVTKEVWGHLPERLRQQMTQYYREQFVSKYGDLLRDYYSSLAEREKSPKNR